MLFLQGEGTKFKLSPLPGNKIKLALVKSTQKGFTRSSADADNRLDAFSGQSRSTNMVPFHM